MTKQDVKFWDCEDSEQLAWESIDEAVQEFLECFPTEDWPAELEVRGFAPMKGRLTHGTTLAYLLELLDDTYGDPHGPYTEPTQKMQEAEKVFHKAMLDEYQVWMCQAVALEKVNVAKWIRQHEPEWLAEEDVRRALSAMETESIE